MNRIVSDKPIIIPTGKSECTKAVRAIIILGSQILVARGHAENFTHLPGGHIDEGETPEQALIREMYEEIGRPMQSYHMVAETDHEFIRNYDGTQEVQHSYLYRVHLAPMLNENRQQSKEAGLTYEWYPVHELWRANLMPAFYRELLLSLCGQ